MENQANQPKKNFSIGLTTVLLFIAIIAICVMAYFLFKISNEKQESTENVEKLNSEILELKDTIYDLELKLKENEANSSSSVSSNEYTQITKELDGIDALYVTKVLENNNTYTLQGVIYSRYALDKNKLDAIVKNGELKLNNSTYIVKPSDKANEYELIDPNSNVAIYQIKQNNSNLYYLEAQVQINDVWKLTDSKMQITVDKDTPITVDYTDEKSTVEDTFKNYKETNADDTTNPSPIYNFKFENGKCVELIRVTSAI